jgi:hypothetical protein
MEDDSKSTEAEELSLLHIHTEASAATKAKTKGTKRGKKSKAAKTALRQERETLVRTAMQQWRLPGYCQQRPSSHRDEASACPLLEQLVNINARAEVDYIPCLAPAKLPPFLSIQDCSEPVTAVITLKTVLHRLPPDASKATILFKCEQELGTMRRLKSMTRPRGISCLVWRVSIPDEDTSAPGPWTRVDATRLRAILDASPEPHGLTHAERELICNDLMPRAVQYQLQPCGQSKPIEDLFTAHELRLLRPVVDVPPHHDQLGFIMGSLALRHPQLGDAFCRLTDSPAIAIRVAAQAHNTFVYVHPLVRRPLAHKHAVLTLLSPG